MRIGKSGAAEKTDVAYTLRFKVVKVYNFDARI